MLQFFSFPPLSYFSPQDCAQHIFPLQPSAHLNTISSRCEERVNLVYKLTQSQDCLILSVCVARSGKTKSFSTCHQLSLSEFILRMKILWETFSIYPGGRSDVPSDSSAAVEVVLAIRHKYLWIKLSDCFLLLLRLRWMLDLCLLRATRLQGTCLFRCTYQTFSFSITGSLLVHFCFPIRHQK